MGNNQIDHVGEILMAVRGELQLNQHGEFNDSNTLDHFARRQRLGERYGAWFSRPREHSSYEKIDCNLIDAIDESPRATGKRFIVLRDKSFAKFLQPFLR